MIHGDPTHLKDAAHDAHGALDRARASYREAARRYLLAELVAVLDETPGVAALHLDAQYEYDDEGGYFRCVSGTVTIADESADDEILDEYWTEGLDVEQAVILELFGVDRTGEGSLARAEIYALAAAEGIASSGPPGSDPLRSPAPSRQEV